MASSTYDIGDVVRLAGAWTDPLDGDAAIDPTEVYCTVRDPSGNLTTYEYGVDAGLTKASEGNYYLDLDADESGIWHYRFHSAGNGKAAEEKSFTIIDALALPSVLTS